MMTTYPKRKDAVFTEENDHNPLIQKECPSCCGYGKRDIPMKQHSEIVGYSLAACSECKGTGIIKGVQQYFENDNPEMEAEIDGSGWVKCSNCGIRFATYDRHRWTGRRHLRCGQKLVLKRNE
jgi:hypothetical protein